MSHNTIPSAQPPARRNQLDVLEDIAGGIDALVDAGGGGGGGADRELIIETYRANKNFTGATTGNLITATRMIDVSGTEPEQVGVTAWFNETTQLALAGAPLAADIDMAGGGGGATNAELIAALSTQTTAIKAGVISTGNVASGVLDSGNPVKIGGVYNVTPLNLGIDKARADLQITYSGSLLTTTAFADANTAVDGQSAANVRHAFDRGANTILPTAAGFLFNGTTWDRARGTVRGAWIEGAVASAAADSGNPVKVGGVYRGAQPVLTDGQRADLQVDARGGLRVAIAQSGITAEVLAVNSDAVATSAQGLNVVSFNHVYNGSGWNRLRGDTTGLAVNTLKQPLVARQLATTVASATLQLTAAVKRISIYARGGDIFYRLSNATSTAVITDHFIAQGERLDLDCAVGATPWISTIRAGSTDATLMISELS